MRRRGRKNVAPVKSIAEPSKAMLGARQLDGPPSQHPAGGSQREHAVVGTNEALAAGLDSNGTPRASHSWRSEEHTSELQSHSDLVCRLLLEKKKKKKTKIQKSKEV